MRRIALALALSTLAPFTFAQTATTPKIGSPVRKAILDVLRVPIQKSMHGQKVVFVITHLNTTNEWAFVFGAPKAANGKSLDFRKSDYKEQFDSGAFDENFGALLRKEGGKWTVVTWFLGATDVPWVDWAEKYKAPKSMFPKMGN